jgi:hypothetical protein
MKYSKCPKINQMVVDLLKSNPDIIFQHKGKHGKITNGRRNLIIPSTPSDRRAHLNFKQNLNEFVTTTRCESI